MASLWIALGGALGSVARYWVGLAVAELTGPAFPWGTLLINVLGSFVISYFGYLTLQDGARPASEEMRLFVLVGICGGFTTFSAFSLQTMDLLRFGHVVPALGYIVGSVVLCVLAAFFGRMLAVG